MSLLDKRIIVTRAPHHAVKLVKMLRDNAAIPLIYPCIDIAPPKNTAPLDGALRNLKAYDYLLLTSSNTVLAIFRRIAALQMQIDWSQIKIAVVGSSTARSVEMLIGMKPDFIPQEYTGAALAEGLPMYADMHVFLPQSNIATKDTAEILRERGIDVTVASAYRNVIGQGGEDIPLRLEERRVDAVTFTSGGTIEGFIRRIEPLVAYDLLAACIDASTADLAENYGFKNVVVAQQPTLNSVLRELDKSFAELQH